MHRLGVAGSKLAGLRLFAASDEVAPHERIVAEGMADNDVTSMMKALAIEPLDVRPRLPMHDAPQTGEPAR